MFSFLSILKNWKVIVGAVGIGLAALLIFNYFNTVSDNKKLEMELQQKEVLISQLEEQNERRIAEYELLEDSLVGYQESLSEQQKRNTDLKKALSNAGDNNGQLKECLDTKLPSDLLERLSK